MVGTLKLTQYKQADKMPDNCSECPFWECGACSLPLKWTRNGESIKEACKTKRHKDCTLVFHED